MLSTSSTLKDQNNFFRTSPSEYLDGHWLIPAAEGPEPQGIITYSVDLNLWSYWTAAQSWKPASGYAQAKALVEQAVASNLTKD